jgi:ketosteroid isomerase-like protein
MRMACPILFLSLVSACAQPAAESAADSGAVGTSTAVDVAAEERVVREATQRWASALRRGDTTAMQALYAEEGVWLRPASIPMLNRDSLRVDLRSDRGPGSPADSSTQQQETMRVVVARSGELAYELGRFFTPGNPPSAVGFYTRVWQKRDGQWRLLATAPRAYAPDSSNRGRLIAR